MPLLKTEGVGIMNVSNKAYDILNIIAKIVAPTITFISAVLSIWNVPYTAEITATLGAFDVFIGALVVVLKANYDKRNP